MSVINTIDLNIKFDISVIIIHNRENLMKYRETINSQTLDKNIEGIFIN